MTEKKLNLEAARIGEEDPCLPEDTGSAVSEADGGRADDLTQDEYRFLDSIMTKTFNSVMSIEERVLESRLTAGLTIAEVHTIVAIGLHGMSPMKTVAARLGVSVPTLTSAVNRLVKKGHVERVRDDAYRRLVLLRLTNSGRKACRAHDLFHKRMVVSAVEGLSRNEVEVLVKALTQVKAFFESEAEKAAQ